MNLPRQIAKMYIDGHWPTKVVAGRLLYWVPWTVIEAAPKVLTEWPDGDMGSWLPLVTLGGAYAT